MNNITEILSWEYIGTIAGATAATTLLTQLFKKYLPEKFPTELFAYLIASVLLIVATIFTNEASIQNIGLALLNGAVVAFSAFGLSQKLNLATKNELKK